MPWLPAVAHHQPVTLTRYCVWPNWAIYIGIGSLQLMCIFDEHIPLRQYIAIFHCVRSYLYVKTYSESLLNEFSISLPRLVVDLAHICAGCAENTIGVCCAELTTLLCINCQTSVQCASTLLQSTRYNFENSSVSWESSSLPVERLRLHSTISHIIWLLESKFVWVKVYKWEDSTPTASNNRTFMTHDI